MIVWYDIIPTWFSVFCDNILFSMSVVLLREGIGESKIEMIFKYLAVCKGVSMNS